MKRVENNLDRSGLARGKGASLDSNNRVRGLLVDATEIQTAQRRRQAGPARASPKPVSFSAKSKAPIEIIEHRSTQPTEAATTRRNGNTASGARHGVTPDEARAQHP